MALKSIGIIAIPGAVTAKGAHTTAIVAPDRLYDFAPSKGGALVLADS
jgi:hypothetical protein